MVLLHGFAQTGRAWDPVRARLGDSGRDAVTPDLRGHGSAAEKRPVDLAGVIADLDGVITGVGARAAGAGAEGTSTDLGAKATGVGEDAATATVLAGYSMGGRLALAYAAARPARVQRLILISASPGLADPAERAARRASDETLAARIEQRGIEAFAAEWGRLPLFSGQAPEVAALAHTERLAQDPAGLSAALRGLGTAALPPLWGRLSALELPVDLVVGERDAKFCALADRMARVLPRARVVIVPGAGHALPREAPSAVADILTCVSEPAQASARARRTR